MKNTGRTVFVATLLLALFLTGHIITAASSNICSYRNVDGICIIRNVSIQSQAEAQSIVFPNETSIILKSPNLLDSWKSLLSRIPSAMEYLVILDGFTPEVHVKSTLVDFRAYTSQVRHVVIDETKTFSLKFLTIAHNKLRSIPKNIGKLTNLVKLYLYDNEIQMVNMDHFKNLTQLELLSLHSNRITRIDTTISLSLPNLSEFYLYGNYLVNLPIKLWNFPNLKLIHLHNNKFRIIENFPQHFPNLNETSLYENRWSCHWLNQTADAIFGSLKKVYIGSAPCSGKSVKGICCETSRENNPLVKSMANDQLLQMSTVMERAMEQISGKISNMSIEFYRTNARMDEIRALVEGDRKQVNQKFSDIDRSIKNLSEEIKSTDSSARKTMFDELQKINVNVSENRARIENDRKHLEKKASDLSSDLVRNAGQFTKTHKEMNDEINWVKEKLNKNRALIDDVVEDLYLEELKKQGL